MSGRRDLGDDAAALRELVAEAHGAIKDLDRLLAEYRAAAVAGTSAAADAAWKAGNRVCDDLMDHLQAELNRAAADLNKALDTARRQVVEAVTPTRVSIDPDTGVVTVHFAAGEFDADVPLRSERLAEAKLRKLDP